MHEIELKFMLDEPAADIWRRARKAKILRGAPRARTIRSIYWDTAEHALKKAGIALRLRRDGRRWLQMVKAGRKALAGLSQVGEVEIEAPGGRLRLDAIPDEALRQEILRQVNDAPLAPICETVMRRAAGEIVVDGVPVAELAVDIGTIMANRQAAEFGEIELELLSGGPAGLFDIVQALFPAGGLRFSRLSKSARGYLLAKDGHIEPPLAPRNATDVRLRPTMTVEQAVREILRECVDQIAVNIEVVRALDAPEGPHQLRIGLRRLRSMLAIFADVARSGDLTRLEGEARWLAATVGALRDLDVAKDEIVAREAGAHPQEAALRSLLETLDAEAARQRATLRTELGGARTQTLLLDLVKFVETRGWLVPEELAQTARLATPILLVAGAALDQRWRKVRKRARRIDALDGEQRHDLRKELKKLRYAIEFFASLYDEKKVKPMIRRLKSLQTVFGALNDAAMLGPILDRSELVPVGDAVAQRAAGWVLGASQARAEIEWADAKAQWRKLRKTGPFWR